MKKIGPVLAAWAAGFAVWGVALAAVSAMTDAPSADLIDDRIEYLKEMRMNDLSPPTTPGVPEYSLRYDPGH